MIANINSNIGQVAGDLSEEIGFLERFEFGVCFQSLPYRGTARMIKPRPQVEYQLVVK